MGESRANPKAGVDDGNDEGKSPLKTWLEWLKVVLVPLTLLGLGALINISLDRRQQREDDVRLYTEMMGKREDSDSGLRKDMFNSMMSTFMPRDEKQRLPRNDQLRQDVLSLELLAYNFHESLNLAPLFKEVSRRIGNQPKGPNKELQDRLEAVRYAVIRHQLAVLSDSGTVVPGYATFRIKEDKKDKKEKKEDDEDKAFFDFYPKPGNQGNYIVAKGEGPVQPALLCLSAVRPDLSGSATGGTQRGRNYRWFRLGLSQYDPKWGFEVRLYASKVLTREECQDVPIGGEAQLPAKLAEVSETGEIEIAALWVDPFDFPLINNTRLSHDERCAVAVTDLVLPTKREPGQVTISLAYFPGSRASLREKAYYDDVIRAVVRQEKQKKSFFPRKSFSHPGPS